VHLVHGENTVVVTYRMLPAFRPRRTGKKAKVVRAAAESGSELVDPTAPARRDLLAGVFGNEAALRASSEDVLVGGPTASADRHWLGRAQSTPSRRKIPVG